VNSDARKATWLQMRRSTWNGFTGLTNRMIDSEAFQAFDPVLRQGAIYFWQKAEYAKAKRKPARNPPIGNLSKIFKPRENVLRISDCRITGDAPGPVFKGVKGTVPVRVH